MRATRCVPGTLGERHLGAIAQLEERLVCIQKARGSSPLSSTGQRPNAILKASKQSQTKSQSRRTIRSMTATARRGHGEGFRLPRCGEWHLGGRDLARRPRSLSAGSGSWLIWPQGHRALDGLMDYRAVQVCPGLGHLVQQPGCDEGNRAVRWQRVNPEPAVPLALGPAGAGFAEHQILVVVAVINRPRPKGAGPGPAASRR